MRVNKIEAGKVPPFDEVKDKLAKELKAQLAPDLLIKLVNDFERVLSKTQSMKAAAEELRLKVKTYENVDARGQDASGKQVVIGPARPSWCRPLSPRAKAPRATCSKRRRANTSWCAPTA